MNPSVASLVYICGIAGLFFLDRDKSVQTSKALWLPVFYLLVIGSRPVSLWLGMTPPAGTSLQLDGSPVDRLFFAALSAAAVCVLVHRGRRVFAFVKANVPILIYFLFCLVSVLWSDFPGVAFKRWTKSIGDLLMILIIITDEQPVAALRRLFSRLGFILIPLSLLFIKYYPFLGRGYDQWSGAAVNFGVSSDKNMLGVMTFVLLLGAFWRVLGLVRKEEVPSHRGRHLLAQGTLVTLGIYVLTFAESKTSSVSCVLGAGLVFVATRRFFQRNAWAVHVLVVGLLVVGSLLFLFAGQASIAHALGRSSNLSGRTDIWAAIIPMVPNPVVGAGFESFWLNPRVAATLWDLFPNLPLNEAHNGYIEMYLELGWVGVGLIAIVLLNGYRRSVNAFRREPVIGGLLVAYVVSAIVYSFTEAGFRMMDPIWIFFLLSVIEASAIAAGVATFHAANVSVQWTPEFSAGNGFATDRARRNTVGVSYDAKPLVLTRTYDEVIKPTKRVETVVRFRRES
jgi:exopolysaccharide production protein ExoQ